MPSTSYAPPLSSVTETAQRAVAKARFSSYGRSAFGGPRLPLPIDFDTHAPEIALVTYQAFRVLTHTLQRHGTVPPVTATLVLLNSLVFLKPGGVLFGDVCLNPYAVLHLNQMERLVTSAFVHRDLFHLVGNMAGLVQDGSELESREGSSRFLKRAVWSLGLSQACLVFLSALERKIRGRGGANAVGNWFADAGKAFDANVLGLSGTSPGSNQGRRVVTTNPATLPFYTSGVVGFSGVNYALKVAACCGRPHDSCVMVFGLIPVPSRYSVWADLFVNTLISPSSGTFAAHFAGCCAGLLTVYVPKMFTRGMGMRGVGRRLGGDASASRLVRDAGARGSSRGTGGGSFGGSGGSFRGTGNRLGGNDTAIRPSNTSDSKKKGKQLSIVKMVLAPFGALRRAASEGTPLLTHAVFAVGCVLCQQIMTRHLPNGLLSTNAVRSLPLVFEKAVSGRF